MSAWLAAGWARSRFQSVSVVPMSQWLCHGMTNSRLFSVRVIKPVAGVDPVARHDEVDALGRPDPELAAAAEHLLDLVDPDAGGVDRSAWPGSRSRGRDSRSRTRTPATRSCLAEEADHPGAAGHRARRSARRSGPASWCAGRRRPGPRRTRSSRGAPRGSADGNSSNVLRRPRCRRWCGTPRPAPITSYTPMPSPAYARSIPVFAQRVEEPDRLGQVRASLFKRQRALLERLEDQMRS